MLPRPGWPANMCQSCTEFALLPLNLMRVPPVRVQRKVGVGNQLKLNTFEFTYE